MGRLAVVSEAIYKAQWYGTTCKLQGSTMSKVSSMEINFNNELKSGKF